jgi:hypothetical protein
MGRHSTDAGARGAVSRAFNEGEMMREIDFEKGTVTTKLWGLSITRKIRPKAFRVAMMHMARDIVRQEEIVDRMKPEVYGPPTQNALDLIFKAHYCGEDDRVTLFHRVEALEEMVYPKKRRKK